jgi:endoglucanase
LSTVQIYVLTNSRGSKADETALEADIRAIRQNFTNIPLVLGEYAASPVATEPAARWKWCDFLMRTTKKYNTATFLWDNGNDFLDRSSHKWRDPTTLEIIMGANSGARNSLPDSTVDGKEKSQSSSAYIFHKIGEPLKDQTSTFLLNGNTIKGVTGPSSKPLAEQTDYRKSPLAGGKRGLTFTKEFLNKFVSPNAPPGIKANLTVHFSAGANSQITIVQWDVPSIAGGVKSSKAVARKNLEIPITWKGVPRIAAVKAVFKDGTYLADDWTKWLGPLQAGYAVGVIQVPLTPM